MRKVEETTKRIVYVTIIPLFLFTCATLGERIYIYDHLGLNFVFAIILFVPVASVLLFNLYWYLKSRIKEMQLKEYFDLLFVTAFSFFLSGYFIHFVGNDLNNLLDEQVELAYLYDEIIGHIIPYFGTIGVFLVFVYLQYKAPLEKKISTLDLTVLISLSILFGLFSAYGVIEGQTPYIGYGFAPLFAIIMYWIIHRKNIGFRQVPVILFVTVTAIVTFIIMIVYGIYFWGWPQPSELLK